MMHEPEAEKASPWKRPMTGWGRVAAWALLIVSLAVVTRVVLGLTSIGFSDAPSASRWLLCIGIPLTATILIALLVRSCSSWRNFKRFLLGIACLAGLLVLFYAEENIRGRLAWSHFKARWEAKGETFDFTAFIPPAVPDEQNFAMAPVVATTYGQILDRNGHRLSPPNTNVVNRLQMPLDYHNEGPTNGIGNWQKATSSNLEAWQRYYRNLSLSTNLLPVAPQPQSPAADVLLALSKYDSTIEELREAAARPASRFPLNYDSEQPFAILLPHLAPLKGCAAVLRLRALAELEAGQSEGALTDIRLALNLTEKIRSEPFLISHLVRVAMLTITEQAIWEGLARHRWNEAQLSALDQQLATFDLVADYAAAMRGETACAAASIEYLRQHSEQLGSIAESNDESRTGFGDLSSHLVPSGWFYQNELAHSKFVMEEFLPMADVSQQTISPRLLKHAEESLSAMRATPYTVICRMLLPGLSHSAHRFAFAQNAVNLARTAGALERYRLAHGNYPETLDPLASQFIAKVPHDIIGGQPLHYRPEDDAHFILYSIGWNEEDDGGAVVQSKNGFVDLDKGDWVWRILID